MDLTGGAGGGGALDGVIANGMTWARMIYLDLQRHVSYVRQSVLLNQASTMHLQQAAVAQACVRLCFYPAGPTLSRQFHRG